MITLPLCVIMLHCQVVKYEHSTDTSSILAPLGNITEL